MGLLLDLAQIEIQNVAHVSRDNQSFGLRGSLMAGRAASIDQRLEAACVRPLRKHSFSETIAMKAILVVALVLGFCGLAGAADVNPVGTWKCEYKIGDQQRTSTLTIKKDGDNLAGTMSWPDQQAE